MALNFDMMGLGFHFFVKDEATLGLKKIDEAFKNVSADAEEMYHKTKASLDQLESKFGALSDHRVQAALQKTGLTLMGIGTAGIAMSGMAVRSSIGFESAFTGVRKTVDATEAEYDLLRQQIRQMAKEIPASAEEISTVAEAAGQLGIHKGVIMDFTRAMIDLGEATNLTSEQAATALARFANIVQMPQDQFDRLGSTIVALGNSLATTESEIVEMALRLAGAGHQVGMTEAEILALAGALSSVGIDAEAGGSAMSRVMIEIANSVAKGGEQLELFAAVAGMTSEQFSKAFQEDAAEAIIFFIEGLNEISKSGINVFAVLDELGLSEIRVRDALLRASGAGDLFRESMKIGTQAWEENIALAREAEERYETTESQLQILRNTFKDIGYTFGDVFLPTVNRMVRGLNNILGIFGKLPAPIQSVIAGALLFGSVLLFVTGGILLFISKIPSIKMGLVILQKTWLGVQLAALKARAAALAHAGASMVVRGATLAWAGAQKLLNIVLSANPIGLIIMAIAALTAGIILLVKNWEKVTATVGIWWDKLTTWFSRMPGLGKALLAIFMPIIGIPLLIAEHWEQIKGRFSALPGTIAGIIEQIPGFLAKLFFEDIPYWIGFGIGYMLRLGWEGIEALVGFFASLPGRIIAFVMNLAMQIPIWWTNIKETSVAIVSRGIDAIIGFFAALPGAIWSFIVEIPGTILNIGASLWSAARQAGSQALDGMISAMNGLPGQIHEILHNAVNNIINFGPRLLDAGKQAFGRLWQGVKDGLGIHSPSYIERAMANIMGASQNAMMSVEKSFSRLNALRAKPTIDMVTSYQGSAEAMEFQAGGQTEPQVAPVPQVTIVAPPPATIRRTQASQAETTTKSIETIRQPIQLVLDGRIVSETVIEFIEDMKIRRVVPE